MSYTIINNNNITHLKTISDNTIDAIITDPPYGIEFLGKDWDSNTGAVETWQQCLRVLKPGGYLLAFSAARTYHHLATNIEAVGFEIRDQLMWLYATGFPKAQQIKGHTGWKTSLKPAHEPIVMARKPFGGSTYANMDKWGVGALNIDASRIEYDGPNDKPVPHGGKARQHKENPGWMSETGHKIIEDPQINPIGRFPSNVIGEVAEGYQKYFYCPKVSRRERHTGFEQPNDTATLPNSGVKGDYFSNNISHNNPANKKDPLAHIPAPFGDVKGAYQNGERFAAVHQKLQDPLAHIPTNGNSVIGGMYGENQSITRVNVPNVGNNHPTVKPVALMKYLIRLVTPPNSKVLDPFCGSGSTGMAAVELGHEFIGIELDADYCEIAKKRIEGWNRPRETGNTFNDLFEENNG